MSSDDFETVLIPSGHNGNKKSPHLPAEDDPERPSCGADAQASTPWRSVPRDHPAARDRSLCQRCTGQMDYPDTPRTSLRELIAAGEVENA